MPIQHKTDQALLTPDQLAMHERLHGDLSFFSRKTVRIKTKVAGKILYLNFNRAQLHVHSEIEKMKREKGWVRVIIIKGRQQGISTYVCARYLKTAISLPGTSVYILTHEAAATANLFDKVEFANDEMPTPVKPGTVTQNRTKLEFSNKSGYAVGTAGSKNTGRSLTAHLFHASEPAFWENAEEIDAGVMQIVALLPGTEVIYESTCNGMNWFYKFTNEALERKNKYRVIFVPWHWQEEYQLACEPDFELDDDERKIVRIWAAKGVKLTKEQMNWRRDKIVELKSLRKFKQEYPFTVQEAFQMSGEGFFDPDLVREAMGSKVVGLVGARILGVDPAGDGDRTIFALRRGRQVIRLWKFDRKTSGKMTHIIAANKIAQIIDQGLCDRVHIDKGYGQAIVDLLKDRGYGSFVEGVSFAETPDRDELYANKRAEMMFECREWMEDGLVSLPDDEDMATDFSAMRDAEQNAYGKWVFPPKRKLKKLIGRSPDILDAILLTFARKVRSRDTDGLGNRYAQQTRNTRTGSGVSTLAKRRQMDDDTPVRRRRAA